MWTTRDGYAVTLPRFRRRRLVRRMGQRPRAGDALRVLSGAMRRVMSNARRSSGRSNASGAHWVFRSRIGGMPVVLLTRVVAPGRLELLFMRWGGGAT